LKTKLPLVAALAAVIVASFAFSVWAQARSLASENASLEAALSVLSEQAFGERIDDADDIIDRLDRGSAGLETDPQQELDAFDVLVEVSSAIDASIVHDIDELEVQGEKVKILGIVTAIDAVETIAQAMQARRCFKDVKTGKITRVVNGKRQKYSLTFDVSCEGDDKDPVAQADKGGRQ
jgi:hypothetical protein